MKADYVHKDTLTATDYIELNKNNELLMSYNQALLKENHELKKQLEKNQNPFKGIFAQVNDDTLLRDCGNMNAEINEFKNQQKEFIDWLEDKIKFSTKPTTRVLLKSILQNYKEIIGVSDENNT